MTKKITTSGDWTPADMARISVDTLTGKGLDWAVAKAEGRDIRPGRWRGKFSSNGGVWQPSINPAQGQPILDRERISAVWDGDEWWAGYNAVMQAMCGVAFDGAQGFGPTMLIAGMRARVAHAYGKTLEIPRHLFDPFPPPPPQP